MVYKKNKCIKTNLFPEYLLTRRLLNMIIILISQKYIKNEPLPTSPEELKTPSLFEKGGLGWVKKNYRLITAGLIVENSYQNSFIP